MNALSFIAGMGAGAFAAICGMIVVLRAVINGKSKAQESLDRQNAMSLEALQERNEIGRQQLDALWALVKK